MVERQRVIDEFLREPGQPAEHHNAARELMGDLLPASDAAAVEAEYVLRAGGPGGPYVEIVRYAKERDIDLIIVGTHGRGFVGHMLMGSVAERVVRHAPCPVLSVRHPGHAPVVV
jgi:nucleotide-binding universal stress UspA family protein